MNLEQFAALKAGDAIENPMNGSRGEVVQVAAGGVRVVWGGAEPNTANQFFYSVQSTAWTHWTQTEETP
jgi:hypothetical protein